MTKNAVLSALMTVPMLLVRMAYTFPAPVSGLSGLGAAGLYVLDNILNAHETAQDNGKTAEDKTETAKDEDKTADDAKEAPQDKDEKALEIKEPIRFKVPDEYSVSKKQGLFPDNEGSAVRLDGTTAIVSVFANDKYTSWDLVSGKDNEMYTAVQNGLSIACEWIISEAARFGTKTEFIYDWEEHPELFYTVEFDMSYTYDLGEYTGDTDYSTWYYIENYIDTEAIMKSCEADSVLYMVYFNTDETTEAVTCTRNNYEGMPYPYEICYFFMKDYAGTQPPAVFAHEMLHAYGAPDLYYADEYFGTTEKYIEHIERTHLNDIMRICGDPVTGTYFYDRIVNEITDITAYYVGLSDKSKTVDDWGFLHIKHS